ncbi:MAG: ABC transporter permease subunit [Eubacterium sp.]|nr:ABC transporter permease subunit [Eubacterium sp.]
MKKYAGFYLMFLPVVAVLFIFYYAPMYGISFAFYNYKPNGKEPQFVGLANFSKLFSDPTFWVSFKNTLIISTVNLALATVTSVVVALLLNEIQRAMVKKVINTVLYLPHFLSWVVVASIFMLLLQPNGLLSQILYFFHLIDDTALEQTDWLTQKSCWRIIFYFINRWKEIGWGTVIYIAALTGISPDYYEAAEIDGANRWQQTLNITLPSISNTILVVFILDLAKVMNIFESVFVLYNSAVYSVADVIGTYTYRVGLRPTVGLPNYGYSTTIGIFKSIVSLILVLITDEISKRIRGYGLV